jgi:hypothetical protein
MQIGFHLLENVWNYVVWLLLSYDLHSRKQSKTKTIKRYQSPTIMQQADEAVSKRNEVHESEYTARYSV